MLGALWHDSRLMGLLAGLFGLLSFAIVLITGLKWLIALPAFDMQKVELTGQVHRINLVGFENQVLPKVQGSYFSINLKEIRSTAQSQAWVRNAVVRRRWPDTVEIRIEEHQPLALWGESQMVNTFGEVFTANIAEANLPEEMARLEGPAGSEYSVARMYVSAFGTLEKLGLRLSEVRLSERFSWSLATSAGLKIELGRETQELSIQDRLRRLTRILPSLQNGVMDKIESVDLRYPKALAVKGVLISTHLEKGLSGVAPRLN